MLQGLLCARNNSIEDIALQLRLDNDVVMIPSGIRHRKTLMMRAQKQTAVPLTEDNELGRQQCFAGRPPAANVFASIVTKHVQNLSPNRIVRPMERTG